MLVTKFLRFVLIAFFATAVSLPAQSAMVGTAQIQSPQLAAELGSISAKRDWIREQLELGGVDQRDASLRVAAMTDAQVLKLHQRIDQQPAGGNVAVAIILIILFTELMGFTDIIPAIRPAR